MRYERPGWIQLGGLADPTGLAARRTSCAPTPTATGGRTAHRAEAVAGAAVMATVSRRRVQRSAAAAVRATASASCAPLSAPFSKSAPAVAIVLVM